MKIDRLKNFYHLQYDLLRVNPTYQVFCEMKATGKGYRYLLRKAGLNPGRYEHHLECLYNLFGNPCLVDFQTYWTNYLNTPKGIKDFSKTSRKKIRTELAKLWDGGNQPSVDDVMDFIERKIINRKMGRMIGSRNRYLLAVDIKNVQTEELGKQLEKFIREATQDKTSAKRRLENLHYHLLMTSESMEVAKKNFMAIYGKEPGTSDDTFGDNPKRYFDEIATLQYHLICGKFPGPKSLTKEQAMEVSAFQKANLL